MLTPKEFLYVIKERQNPIEILKIKKDFYDAEKQLINGLTKKLKSDKIVYNPEIWKMYESIATCYKNGVMGFSIPNKEIPFDFCPEPKTRLGLITHEKFGHPADDEQYYSMDEYMTYISPEQRANLRSFCLFPDAVYHFHRSKAYSCIRLFGYDPSELKEYKEPLGIIETLGQIGMPRTDDIPRFFKEMDENTEIPIGKILEKVCLFSFAGLSTQPYLNDHLEYGIKRGPDLYRVIKLVSDYISDKTFDDYLHEELIKLNYKTTIDEEIKHYHPEESIDLRWIKLDVALKNQERELIYWNHKALQNNDWKCYEDIAGALTSLHDFIRKWGDLK